MLQGWLVCALHAAQQKRCPCPPLPQGASVVLEGQRVVPARAQEAGFQFKYSQVSDALRNVLKA